MNRGLNKGTISPTINYYQPSILSVVASTGALSSQQPDPSTMDGHTYQFGRYCLLNPTTVYVEVQMQFLGVQGASTGAVGNGDVYCWSLPEDYPLRRAQPGQIDRTPLGPAFGQCYLSFGSATTPDHNLDAVPVAADPWTALAGIEDQYFSAMVPYAIAVGTGSFSAASSTLTFNNANGTPVPNFVFNPDDISEFVAAADNIIANGALGFYNSAISSGSFTMRPSANTSATLPVSYKIMAEPPTGQAGALVGPHMPFEFGAVVTALTPFANFFFTLVYETQGTT